MKNLSFCPLLVCLLVSLATAQDRPSSSTEQNVVLDVRVIDLDVLTTEEMDRVSRDKAKLEQMIAQGKAKVVVGTQLQTAANQPNTVRIGQRVPVQTRNLTTTESVPQIQYENTGFTFTFTPRILSNDFVEIKFNLEITALDVNTGRFTPTFVQRTLNGGAKLKPGETTMLFGLAQSEGLMPNTTPQTDKSNSNSSRGNFCVLLRARIL